MRNDKRKARRRIIHHTASILLEAEQTLPCSILDVSDTGARLESTRPDAVPDRFGLLLSENGQPRRLCRVVWRDGRQIGVTFENRPPSAERFT